MTLPNILTCLRVLLIPVFMVLAYQGTAPCDFAALVVYVAACLTDYVDGNLARKNNQITNFGKFMDPVADKLLVISAMAMFCEWGVMPAWALMIVLTREFAVTGLRLVAAPKGTVIAAGKSGKFKTASTMIGLCVMMAFPGVAWLSWTVIGIIVATTLYSGVEYFIQNWNCLWD